MARKTELSCETRQSILVLRNEGYSMREIAKKLKMSSNGVYYSLQRTAQTGNQSRKRSGRPRCTTQQEDKYIRVSSLRNRRLTGLQLAASLNGTCKTPVSTSTVKRRLRDAGLLGRVAKKKSHIWDWPIKRKDWYGQKNTDIGQRKIGKKCYGAFFDESKVWRIKLIFQIKIIISNLVNVLTIFSIHFANHLINRVFMENTKLSGWRKY